VSWAVGHRQHPSDLLSFRQEAGGYQQLSLLRTVHSARMTCSAWVTASAPGSQFRLGTSSDELQFPWFTCVSRTCMLLNSLSHSHALRSNRFGLPARPPWPAACSPGKYVLQVSLTQINRHKRDGGELLVMSPDKVEIGSFDWRKAARSIGNGNCVEVAPADGQIAVRDSKDPAGPILRYSATGWQSFLHDARCGNFDRRS
jgi:Domain of unknown function (DUF397)